MMMMIVVVWRRKEEDEEDDVRVLQRVWERAGLEGLGSKVRVRVRVGLG